MGASRGRSQCRLEGITGGVSSAVTSVDGIATSIDNLQDAMGQADYWTDAVGNYSKELLEATYSTEELVEMGMKSADALEEQNRMLELCERSATELSQSMDATTQIQQDLSAAMDSAAETAKALSKNEDVSAEAKEALAKASTEASGGHAGAGQGPAGSGRGDGGLQPDDGLRDERPQPA